MLHVLYYKETSGLPINGWDTMPNGMEPSVICTQENDLDHQSFAPQRQVIHENSNTSVDPYQTYKSVPLFCILSDLSNAMH